MWTGIFIALGIVLGIVATGFVYIKLMQGSGGTIGLSLVAIVIIGITVSICGMIGNTLDGIPASGTGRATEYSLECKSCGRSFTDDSNIKSIRLNGMCTNCKKNYDTAQNALK